MLAVLAVIARLSAVSSFPPRVYNVIIHRSCRKNDVFCAWKLRRNRRKRSSCDYRWTRGSCWNGLHCRKVHGVQYRLVHLLHYAIDSVLYAVHFLIMQSVVWSEKTWRLFGAVPTRCFPWMQYDLFAILFLTFYIPVYDACSALLPPRRFLGMTRKETKNRGDMTIRYAWNTEKRKGTFFLRHTFSFRGGAKVGELRVQKRAHKQSGSRLCFVRHTGWKPGIL